MTEYDSYLEYLTFKGALERYDMDFTIFEEIEHAIPDDDAYLTVWQRLQHELDVITKAGFASYFLIVADIMRFCREQDIPVGPGRGSVCGSSVAYCLYITDVEPIEFGIPFERFLHLERIAQPDIDIDLCQARRQEVIDYIRQKYVNVAQIATFGTMMAKGVVRDVCRVLQMEHGLGDKLASMIPEGSGADQVYLEEFRRTEEGIPFYEMIKDLRSPVDGSSVWETCLRLEGIKRHGSSHAAGVVMADRPLSEIVPLWRRNKDAELHTHFDYVDAEDIGLLKMDLLGLRTVTVIGDAEKLVRERQQDFSIKGVLLDDAATFAMLSAGDTVGVFQLEGDGITNAVKGMKPDSFNDIIAILALYRPGPMEQLQTYIDRKHGKEDVSYVLPELEDTLSRTYGLIVFQEQVMGMARVLAGYTPGEADLFRKAIGKKLPELIRVEISKFIERSIVNGYDKKTIELIGQQIAFFGRYGFNLGHATGYAFITYWTAYLKANFPGEFYTATLNSHVSDSDTIGKLLLDAKRHGVVVSCPNINESGRNFSLVDPMHIRFGIEAVKGVGAKAVIDILEERDSTIKNSISRERVQKRKDDGTKYMATVQVVSRVENEPRPYDDIWDFCARLPGIPITVKKALVAAGAFVEDFDDRAKMIACLPELNVSAKAGDQYDIDSWDEQVPNTLEMIKMEQDVLGFYVTKHPLDEYRDLIERYGGIIDGTFDGLNTNCCVAGIVTEIKTHQSKRGEMAWVRLESGIRDLPKITIFSDQWLTVQAEVGTVLLVWGKKEKHAKFGWSIIANKVHVVDEKRTKVKDIYVLLPDTDIADLAELAQYTDTKGPVLYLVVEGIDKLALISTDKRVWIPVEAQREIESRGGHIRYDPGSRRPLPWGSGWIVRSSNPDLAILGRGNAIWDAPVVRTAIGIFGGKVIAEMESK